MGVVVEMVVVDGVIVVVLLIAVHCCGPHDLPVNSSTGADKSDGSPVDMPVFTSTL